MTELVAAILGAVASWRFSNGTSPVVLVRAREWPLIRILLCLVVGALAAVVSRRVEGLWSMAAFSLFCSGALVVALVDLFDFRIPTAIIHQTGIVGGALLLAAATFEHQWARAANAAIGASLSLGVFLVLHLLAPRGLGFGDVRLAALCGGFLGWLSLSEAAGGLAIGIVLAGVTAAVLLVARLVRRTSFLPLGPFLAAGSIFVLVIH